MTNDDTKIIHTEMTNDNLGLKEFKGVARQYTEDGGLIYIMTADKRPVKCIKCGNTVFHKHTPYNRKVRDQDISGKTVGIIVKGNKFRCSKCKRIQTPDFPSIHESTKMTQRFWEEVAFECFNYKLHDVCARYRLSHTKDNTRKDTPDNLYKR